MIRFAKMACPGYDIYKTSGYREGQPIPLADAAERVTSDIVERGHYVDFVELLVQIDSKGYMGKRYSIRGLDDVLTDLLNAGYSFDKTTGQFFENQAMQVTRNWGRLLDGDERQMSVLRLDIAGNSILVKEHPKALIDKAYGDLRKFVTRAVVSRLGRLWTWEGDGALAVFMLGDYSRWSIYAGIEILNEMFIYNKVDNPLGVGINLRMAVHSGPIVYSKSEAQCLKSDTVKKAIKLESQAAVPNSLAISDTLAVAQEQALLDVFSNTKSVSTEKYRLYQVNQASE
jgi:class 3 adenylate cyclase